MKSLNTVLGKISNITIGRSDLSSSFFNDKITQNSIFITKLILKISQIK